MTIELSPAEVEVLKKLLEHEIGELNPEIHHTRTATFRDELMSYREILRGLYQRTAAGG